MLQLADCGVRGCARGCWLEVVTACTCYITYYQEALNLTPYCHVFPSTYEPYGGAPWAHIGSVSRHR